MLDPTPSVGRANPSACGGLGRHVIGGAGLRPAARAMGRGPIGERVWPAPGEGGWAELRCRWGAEVIATREG